METGNQNVPDHEEPKNRLSELRNALLALHKTVVDSERVSYEATAGPIESSSKFLQLLTDDAWFAWLRPFSQLIVAMDQAMDDKEPLTSDTVGEFFSRTSQLLVASENAEGFTGHYHSALQRDPDVVMAHAEVAKLIGPRRMQPPESR